MSCINEASMKISDLCEFKILNLTTLLTAVYAGFLLYMSVSNFFHASRNYMMTIKIHSRVNLVVIL